MIKVYAYDSEDMSAFSLWWDDLDEAGVNSAYVAYLDGELVGFQTVNADGRCVAIEVLDEYQGKGVARALIEESGCYRPERNENPDFWGAIADYMESVAA